jgi:hypothetical protein
MVIFDSIGLIRRTLMATQLPTIGQWFQDIPINRLFEIIGQDQYCATLDIRYEDGEIDQIDLECWAQMSVVLANPPQDWRSLFELSDEQRLFSDDIIAPAPGTDVLAGLEPDSQFGWDEF